METTRGCPIDCEFCAVTSAFGGSFRNRPQDEVLAELKTLRPFTGLLTLKRLVFFVDDNIVSNRAYAREFFSRIADLNLNWFGQASVNIAKDPEILKLAEKSGCTGLFMGFETLSTGSHQIHRQGRQQTRRIPRRRQKNPRPRHRH